MRTLFKCVYGSRLYGTDTPDSDYDEKGVGLPSLQELVLQKAPQNITSTTKPADRIKNNKDDIDTEIYSLHYFLKLAFKGETCALDMLHTPPDMTLITSREWEFMHANRSRFYTRRMDAFLGYCRKQCGKYGVKGSRLNAADMAIKLLSSVPDKNAPLSSIYDVLPVDGTTTLKYEHLEATQADKRVWDVCGRKLMATTPIYKCLETLQSFYAQYGERARAAANNQDIDWKCVSHAFRAAMQMREIYTTGDLVFPLKDAEFLRDVKNKKFHYINDGISERLDTLISEVENLAVKSSFPEEVDRSFWEQWLVSIYKTEEL